jgi:hypothetical protein
LGFSFVFVFQTALNACLKGFCGGAAVLPEANLWLALFQRPA